MNIKMQNFFKKTIVTASILLVSSCAGLPKSEQASQNKSENAKRSIASVAELDYCYDQSTSNDIDSGCKAVLLNEKTYAEGLINEAVDAENSSDEIANHEQLATDLSLDKRKKTGNFFKSIIEAKRQFRDFKSKNSELVSQAKTDFKKFRKELRNNSEFSKNLKNELENCKFSNKTEQGQCHLAAMKKSLTKIDPKFSQKYHLGAKNRSVATSSTSGTCSHLSENYQEGLDGSQYHLLLLGKNILNCDTGRREDTLFGPGLYVGAMGYFAYVCTFNPTGRTQVGLTAGAGALLGLSTSLTVGGAGVCMDLSFNPVSIGAFAGITVNEW